MECVEVVDVVVVEGSVPLLVVYLLQLLDFLLKIDSLILLIIVPNNILAVALTRSLQLLLILRLLLINLNLLSNYLAFLRVILLPHFNGLPATHLAIAATAAALSILFECVDELGDIVDRELLLALEDALHVLDHQEAVLEEGVDLVDVQREEHDVAVDGSLDKFGLLVH